MTVNPVIHPNFRIRDQKVISKRSRVLLFPLSQAAFDAVMSKVDSGEAETSREVLARAVEQYLGLEEGAADLRSEKFDSP